MQKALSVAIENNATEVCACLIREFGGVLDESQWKRVLAVSDVMAPILYQCGAVSLMEVMRRAGVVVGPMKVGWSAPLERLVMFHADVDHELLCRHVIKDLRNVIKSYL